MITITSKADVMALPWIENPTRRGDRAGVYLITDKVTGEVVYVGQTASFSNRLCPSVHPVYRKELHDLALLIVDDVRERRYIEARCINVLDPPINQREGQRHIDQETQSAYYDQLFNG